MAHGRLISYIHIYRLFAGSSISYRILSSFLTGWSYVFGGKHPDRYSQHKIVDPYLSSMYWTSCSRKKPSRWKNINTHTHKYQATIMRRYLVTKNQLLLRITTFELCRQASSEWTLMLRRRGRKFVTKTLQVKSSCPGNKGPESSEKVWTWELLTDIVSYNNY